MNIIVKGCSIDMRKIFYPADIASGVICGGGQKSVVGNAQLSSKIMDGFQKNQFRALFIGYTDYKSRRFI